MSSSFIQVKPIGSQMGVLPWHNPTFTSPDFPQARRRVSCNLFGRPEKGAINETYRQEENQRIEEFKTRYIFFNLEEPTINSSISPIAPKDVKSESRLSENLIEKELREHEKKLNQHKNTVSGSSDEIVVAGDRIRSRTIKQMKPEEMGLRIVVDNTSAKCNNNGERPKPYARQQSITDFYPQRKTVVCNNSRTSEEHSLEEASDLLLPHPVQEKFTTESLSTATDSAVAAIDSSSTSITSSSSTQWEEQEQKISLQTMTTDCSAELA